MLDQLWSINVSTKLRPISATTKVNGKTHRIVPLVPVSGAFLFAELFFSPTVKKHCQHFS